MLDSTRISRPRVARRRISEPTSIATPARFESVEPRVMFAVFNVTTTADSGAGSLRAAIDAANAAPNPSDDADYILFEELGPGLHTITPLTPLPTITDSVTIDGTSAVDLMTPSVELNGSSAGAGRSPTRGAGWA